MKIIKKWLLNNKIIYLEHNTMRGIYILKYDNLVVGYKKNFFDFGWKKIVKDSRGKILFKIIVYPSNLLQKKKEFYSYKIFDCSYINDFKINQNILGKIQ